MIEDHLFFTGVNILLAWSVYVILLTGTMSFGNVAFMAIGAYTAGVLTVKFGVWFEAAVVVATLACLLVGIVVGYPALRTRGLYLIMVTIGLVFCVRVLLENTAYVGGVGGMGGMLGATVYHVSAALLLVGTLLWVVSKSPLQRILDAVREDEIAAASLGINVVYVRIAAFALGAALAGLAGALFSHYMIFVAPEHFGIMTSFFIVLYVIFGGMNSLWGPLLGATLMTLLPEFIRPLAEWRTSVFCGLLVLILLVRPDGLLPFRSVSTRLKQDRAAGPQQS
jgi:branched-chain amino acid transport system permease protein